MAVNMIARQVQGPEKDWLTEGEVLALLGNISSTTLKRYIRDGDFPRGVLFGRDRQWRWIDVTFFYLQKELSDRLTGRPTAEDDEDDEDEGESTVGQPRVKAGSQK